MAFELHLPPLPGVMRCGLLLRHAAPRPPQPSYVGCSQWDEDPQRLQACEIARCQATVLPGMACLDNTCCNKTAAILHGLEDVTM